MSDPTSELESDKPQSGEPGQLQELMLYGQASEWRARIASGVGLRSNPRLVRLRPLEPGLARPGSAQPGFARPRSPGAIWTRVVVRVVVAF